MTAPANTIANYFNPEPLDKDYTPNHLKLIGPYENDRNSVYADLYKAIIREVYGVTDVICGHHLVMQIAEKRADGFTYQVVQEVPSADELIFDHEVARKLWGDNQFKDVLCQLACEPIATRDVKLAELFYGRGK